VGGKAPEPQRQRFLFWQVRSEGKMPAVCPWRFGVAGQKNMSELLLFGEKKNGNGTKTNASGTALL
jgi:hypothetical protein